MSKTKEISVAVMVALVICSSATALASSAAFAATTAPSVQGPIPVSQISSGQQGCLNRYQAGPPALGTGGITAAFTNYAPGTEVQFRISNPSGGWLTHVIDYVSS